MFFIKLSCLQLLTLYLYIIQVFLINFLGSLDPYTLLLSVLLLLLPTLNNFVSPSNIFSHCFPLLCFPLIILIVTRCSIFFLLITKPKKLAWHLLILFMSDLVVSASCNTVLFDFFAVHEIHSILQRNQMSVASSFFCTCFEIVQALHPYVRMGSI